MAERKKKDEQREPEFQRLPPQAVEVEQNVLGAMMLDTEAFGRAVEILDEHCFYKPAHQMIYSAMRKLFNDTQPIDMLTVAERLKSMGRLEEAGGAYYLTELTEMVSSPASVEYYANLLLEKAILRRLISTSTDIIDESYRPDTRAPELLDKAQERLFELVSRRDRRGFQPIEDIMSDTLETIELYHQRKGEVTGIATGFKDLDSLTSGLQRTEFIVLAARPSMGKTALALNIARNVAVEGGRPVGFFSLEMNAQMLAYRLLCAESRLNSHKLRTGKLKENEWERLGGTAEAISSLPIYIDDSSNLSVLELRSRARRLAAEKGVDENGKRRLGLIVIDYLQIMQPPPEADSQQQAIASISRSLKALAKELEVPVLAVSQLSRAVETRGGDKRPQLSDLRDSGAIEQDADVVMFVYRPSQYRVGQDELDEEELRKAEVIVSKQRNGPTGKIDLIFNREYARFDNISRFDEGLQPIEADFAEEEDDQQPY